MLKNEYNFSFTSVCTVIPVIVKPTAGIEEFMRPQRALKFALFAGRHLLWAGVQSCYYCHSSRPPPAPSPSFIILANPLVPVKNNRKSLSFVGTSVHRHIKKGVRTFFLTRVGFHQSCAFKIIKTLEKPNKETRVVEKQILTY